MDKIRLTTKDDDYPIVYRVLTIPGGAGFRPSTVFYHPNDFQKEICWKNHHWMLILDVGFTKILGPTQCYTWETRCDEMGHGFSQGKPWTFWRGHCMGVLSPGDHWSKGRKWKKGTTRWITSDIFCVFLLSFNILLPPHFWGESSGHDWLLKRHGPDVEAKRIRKCTGSFHGAPAAVLMFGISSRPWWWNH